MQLKWNQFAISVSIIDAASEQTAKSNDLRKTNHNHNQIENRFIKSTLYAIFYSIHSQHLDALFHKMKKGFLLRMMKMLGINFHPVISETSRDDEIIVCKFVLVWFHICLWLGILFIHNVHRNDQPKKFVEILKLRAQL